jgi:hypothetical protein
MATPNFTYFASAGSLLLKTGAGNARATSPGVPGVVGNVTLYDGLDATGKVIGDLAANVGRDLDFSCQFDTGLYVVATGNPNTTISFY